MVARTAANVLSTDACSVHIMTPTYDTDVLTMPAWVSAVELLLVQAWWGRRLLPRLLLLLRAHQPAWRPPKP